MKNIIQLIQQQINQLNKLVTNLHPQNNENDIYIDNSNNYHKYKEIEMKLQQNELTQTLINQIQQEKQEIQTEIIQLFETFEKEINTFKETTINEQEQLQDEMKTISNEIKPLNETEKYHQEEQFLFSQWNKGKEYQILFDSDKTECTTEIIKNTLNQQGDFMMIFEGNENNIFAISFHIETKDYMGTYMDKNMTFYAFKNSFLQSPSSWKSSSKDIPKVFLRNDQQFLFSFGSWKNKTIKIASLGVEYSMDDYSEYIPIIPRQLFIGSMSRQFIINRILILSLK